MILRLWGIGWSLPDARHPLATYHPDELINLNAAQAADISHGKLDIGFYNYGTFYFYIVSLAHTVGRGYHWIPSTPPDPTRAATPIELLEQQAPEQAALFLAGRLITVLLGTATIPIVFLLGGAVYSEREGLLAALIYALAPLAVIHAHFLTVDVPATFFVSLALLWAARLLRQPAWKDVVVAGLWCGLAAATKYTAAVAIVGPLFSLALQFRLISRPGGRRALRTNVLQAGALVLVALLAFLAACPGPWLNWKVFWYGIPHYPGSGVRYELFDHARTGHGYLFVNSGYGWWYHLAVSLRYGLGLPLLLLCGAGVAVAVRARERGDLLLLAFVAVAYTVSSLSEVRFARYLIPLYPALAVLAARAVFAAYGTPVWRRAAHISGICVCLMTAGYSVSLVHAMAVEDPRDRAADYLRRSQIHGATVAFAHIPWFYTPPLSPVWGAPSSGVRAKGVDESAQFQFVLPGQPWDRGVLTPAPTYVLLSRTELQHEWKRLHLPPAVAFMAAVEQRYAAAVFSPSPVVGLPADDVDAPEDLLYVLPTVYVYAAR